MGVPLTGLGEVHDFKGDKISHLIAFVQVKFSAGIVKGRKHDLDVLRIES
jgi:hypothetical protein